MRNITNITNITNTNIVLLSNFNNQINSAEENMNRLKSKFEKASEVANKLGSSMGKMAISATKNIATIGKQAMGIGLKEALDVEGYRTQLESATNDTKKASDIMKCSIKLANKTPFEVGELAQGATAFETMGISAKKWLNSTGNMAASTNKSFSEATEAVIEAQSGELGKLEEFGIKKEDVAKYAYEKMGKTQLLNNQGQIMNQEKFNDALKKLMDEKFTGGMETQANTAQGLWDTLVGSTKSSLATIVGITSDGTVKQGSLLETLKGKMKSVIDQLAIWQEDGTLDNIANKVSGIVTVAFESLTSAVGWCKENMDWLLPVVSGLATALIAFSIISTLADLFLIFAGAGAVLTGSFLLIPLAIGACVALGVALIANWDKVVAKAKEVGQNIKDVFSGKWEAKVVENKVPLEYQKDNVKNSKQEIVEENPAETNPNIKNLLGSNQNEANSILDSYFSEENRGQLNKLAIPVSGYQTMQPSLQMPPLDNAKALNPNPAINVNVVIQGNVIGNKAFVDDVGNQVTRRVMLALDNM